MKNTEKFMVGLTKHADIALLFFALLSFGVLGTFKFEYYNSIFKINFYESISISMAICVALLIEGTRFSLLLASAEDARTGNTRGFILGLIGSIGLLVYDFILCAEIGVHWSVENGTYTNMLRFVAILGMLLEIRLCLLMSAGSVATTPALSNEQPQQPQQPPQQPQQPQQQVQQPQQQVQNEPFVMGKYFKNTNSITNSQK